MMNYLRTSMLVYMSVLIASCATYDDKNSDKNNMNEPGASDLILCEEPRPEVCTREYDPVCGSLRDGSVKTGSTACTSCSDSEVVGYKSGAC